MSVQAVYGRPPCKIRRSGREKRSFDAQAGPSRMASSFLPASAVRFPQRFAGQKKTGKGIFAARCRFEAAHIRPGRAYLCRKLHVSIPCSVISLPPSAALRHEGIHIPSDCGNRHVFAELFPLSFMRPLTFRYRFEAGAFDAARPPLPSPASADTIRQGFGDSLRRAAFGASASDAPESKGSRVVSEALETPIRGLLGRSGNLALRGCPARRAPCGRTPEHPRSRRSQGIRDYRHLRCRRPAPLGRPAGKRTPGHKQKEGGAGYGG